jgi:hypothetical protein
MPNYTKTEFEIIEGQFHDGLGTYAEITLANEIIETYGIDQQLIDYGNSIEKMNRAIERLPSKDATREIFKTEIENIKKGSTQCVALLRSKFRIQNPTGVFHSAKNFSNAKAADLQIICDDASRVLLSVKTDKSGKVAIADGQTPFIFEKWAHRFFQINRAEYDNLLDKLGYESENHLKTHYLNVANFVAKVLITELGIVNYEINDFSQARATNINAVKYLLNQLLFYKKGSDNCHVVVIDRKTGTVKWETILDSIDIDRLVISDVAFLPSRPRHGRPIGSEFGIKIHGKTIVSFQVKHKRGKARETNRRDEFLDITTRLRI